MSTDVVVLAHEEGGRGHPLILLHAFPLHRGMWAPQREALAGIGRLVRIPGAGYLANLEAHRAFATALAEHWKACADRETP